MTAAMALCVGAWLAVCVSAAFLLVDSARTRQRDLVIAAGLLAAAAVLRCAAPWGPTGFAEASRIPELWNAVASSGPGYEAVRAPVSIARSLGAGPLVGGRAVFTGASALEVALVFAAARALGVARIAAVAGALVIALWPSHVRFGASPSTPVVSSMIVTATYAIAALGGSGHPLSQSVRDARWFALGLLLGLSLFARAETPLPAAVAASLALGAHWRWSERARAAVTAGVIGCAYLTLRHATPVTEQRAHPSGTLSFAIERAFERPDLLDWGLVPVPAIAVAAVGLFTASNLLPLTRMAQAAAIFVLVVAYSALGSEVNPGWGQSRYYLVFVPIIALLVGCALGRLSGRTGAWAASAVVVWSIGLFAVALPAVRRPADIGAESRLLRETAERHELSGRVVAAVDGGCAPPDNFEPETLAAAALAEGVGAAWFGDCESSPDDESGRLVLRVSDLLDGCPERLTDPDTRLWLGGHAPDACLDRIGLIGELVPVWTERVTAVPISPVFSTECPAAHDGYRGRYADVCNYEVGWYVVRPKSAD